MQVNAFRFTPATRPQAFAINKARFANKSDLQTKLDSGINTAQQDPAFLAELEKYEHHFDQLDNAIRTGKVKFISAQDGLPGSDFTVQEAIWPQITFKLNQQRYNLTVRNTDQPGIVTYEIESTTPTYSKLAFAYFPKDGGTFPCNSTTISLYSLLDGQKSHAAWRSDEDYFPKSGQGTYAMTKYPRQDLVDKAQELGILLFRKLGESRRQQGLDGPLLPEPLKQLDHKA